MNALTSFHRPPFLDTVLGVVLSWLSGWRRWTLVVAALVSACGGGGGGGSTPRFQSIQVNGKTGILDNTTRLVWASSLSATPPDSGSRLPAASELLALIQSTSSNDLQATFGFAFTPANNIPLFQLVHGPSNTGYPWAVDLGATTGFPPGSLSQVANGEPVNTWYLLAPGSVPSFSFTANNDYVQGAGLTWRRCVEGTSWNNNRCEGTPTQFKYSEAVAWASAMNANGTYGGYRDWRVPTLMELQTLLQLNGDPPPYLPATEFETIHNPPVDWARPFWTSTTSGDLTYWGVDFGLGQVSPSNFTGSDRLHLLLVRTR